MSDETKYMIRAEEAQRDYYTQIPNLVDVMHLSPFAYRLYGHLRKVAGETGKCWQNTETLAKECNMSGGTVSNYKRELENVYPPLIRIESKPFEKGIYHEIVITDIWAINHAFWSGEEVTILCADGVAFHSVNDYRSCGELDRSCGETKNNPIKNNPNTSESFFEKDQPLEQDQELKPDLAAPLEWRILSGQAVTQKDLEVSRPVSIPGAEFFTQYHPDQLRYAEPFSRKFGRGPKNKADAKIWRMAIDTAISYKLTPDDLVDQITINWQAGLTVKGPMSVVDSAYSRVQQEKQGVSAKPRFEKKEAYVPPATAVFADDDQ